MDLYTSISRQSASEIIKAYSTSFGVASRLFDRSIKGYISDIYALVRIADEVVDTYQGQDAEHLLDDLEQQVYAALVSGYSTNLIVHAFATTAQKFAIEQALIEPFFTSMRMDLNPPATFDEITYKKYIYGSAEVVGLMCLKIFVEANQYQKLEAGASALGAAFQKINFVRDMAEDHDRLHRYYFPISTFAEFDEATLKFILADISSDMAAAKVACRMLPSSSQYAVGLALSYFELLLNRLAETPVEVIKQKRIRIDNYRKFWLYLKMSGKKMTKVPAV